MDNSNMADFVSYSQYQNQFSPVINKYAQFLRSADFDMESLPKDHQELIALLIENFSKQ